MVKREAIRDQKVFLFSTEANTKFLLSQHRLLLQDDETKYKEKQGE